MTCSFFLLWPRQEQTLGKQLSRAKHSDRARLWGSVPTGAACTLSDEVVLQKKILIVEREKKGPFKGLGWSRREETDLSLCQP